MGELNTSRAYEGKGPAPDAPDDPQRQDYLPSPGAVEAVRLMRFLGRRPLLIKGDPGAGKTQLAHAVAGELGLRLLVWPVKSTSRARDGLYVYNAVRRLHDAQLAHHSGVQVTPPTTLDDYVRQGYIRFGPLGEAFRRSAQGEQTVVLIDEIDKADIDFPNDLLLELDEGWFEIEEIEGTANEKRVTAHRKRLPLIFITSNDERDLPDAFLRRCLFLHIPFPDPYEMAQIVDLHFPDAGGRLLEQAVLRFMELRLDMDSKNKGTGKKVTTSELLDWFKILQNVPEDEVLPQLDGRLPYAQALLKSYDDYAEYRDKQAAKAGSGR